MNADYGESIHSKFTLQVSIKGHAHLDSARMEENEDVYSTVLYHVK